MSEESNANDTDTDTNSKSALQDNIEIKGKHAYYFAHANAATGPKWDGNIEPRLLAKHSSHATDELADSTGSMHITNDNARNLLKTSKQNVSSFDFSKSNITKYAFLDEGAKIKIYIELKGVGDVCSNDDDVTLDWEETSFSVVIRNYKNEDEVSDDGEAKDSEVKCLSFGRLHGPIKKASLKKKTDRIIVILTKLVEEGQEPREWSAVGAKGDAEQQAEPVD